MQLPKESESRFWSGVARTSEFLMGTGDVRKALLKLAQSLESLAVPYAIAGAMALNEFGYVRATSDVDVLLTATGLETFKKAFLGRGYVEKFPGSRWLRDTEHGVPIHVLVVGEIPSGIIRGEKVALLPIEKLIELKLASGLSAPHRLRDLADVQELVKHAKLPRALGDQLDESVRAKFHELWDAAQFVDPEEEP